MAALSGGGGGPYPLGSLYVLPMRFARRGADPGGRGFLASQTIDRISHARLAALRAAVPV